MIQPTTPIGVALSLTPSKKATELPRTVKDNIAFIKENLKYMLPSDAWGPLGKANPTIPIDAYIRRETNPTKIFQALQKNSDPSNTDIEIRPASPVAVLPVKGAFGPVAHGLIGDSYKKGAWSEAGGIVFKNTAMHLFSQKCDVSTQEVTLKKTPGGIDSDELKRSYLRDSADPHKITHIESKFLDDPMAVKTKMVHQALKATCQKPMGSSVRGDGIPKNKFANYVMSYMKHGTLPQLESTMVLGLEDIQACKINTHSKKAVAQSLEFYKGSIEFLLAIGRKDLADGLPLVIHNNQTGELKRVHPKDLEEIYRYAPDTYSRDHSQIHPDNPKLPPDAILRNKLSIFEIPGDSATREQKQADMRAIAISERPSGEKAERHREKQMIKKYGDLLSDKDREIEHLRKENNDLKNSKASSSSIFSFTKGS